MSTVIWEKSNAERRSFPRIKASCLVHYFTHQGGDWFEAELSDYSANGICIITDETILRDTEITIRIMRNAKVRVPPMSAFAKVVRCDLGDDHRYRVACKLTRVRNEQNGNGNRIIANLN